MKYRDCIPNNREWVNLLSATGFEYTLDRPPFKALFLGYVGEEKEGALLEFDHEMVEFLGYISPRDDGYISPDHQGTPVIHLGEYGFALEPVPEPSPLEKAHWRVDSVNDAASIHYDAELESAGGMDGPVVIFTYKDGRKFFYPWANIERLMFFPEGFDPTCDHD